MAIPTLYSDDEAPRMTRGVWVLVAINAAMLFLQRTLVSDADAFAVLGFQDGSLQRSVWSGVTYMFVHASVWHLALNMYGLLLFGPRLEAAMGTRAFTLYYLWCGLGGAVMHLLFFHEGILIGSSAAVLGVMFAYWQQWPRDEVSFAGVMPMRTWTLVVLLGVLMLASGLNASADPSIGGDRFTYLAHLGGLALGWLYFRTPPAASLDRLKDSISPAPDYQDEVPPRAIPRTLPRARAPRDEIDDVVAKSKTIAARKRPASSRAVVSPVSTPREARKAELDRVLDKISSTGIDSLTLDEREVLESMARRLRGE